MLLSSPQENKYKLLIYDLSLKNADGLNMLHSLKEEGIELPPVLMLQQGASFERSLLEQGISGRGQPLPASRRLLLRNTMELLKLSCEIEDKSRQKTDLKLPPIKILVAEDNLANQNLIRHFFKNTGISLVMAADGGQALKLVNNDNYDIILLDMEMPVMDGYEFLSKFREYEAENSKKQNRHNRPDRPCFTGIQGKVHCKRCGRIHVQTHQKGCSDPERP